MTIVIENLAKGDEHFFYVVGEKSENYLQNIFNAKFCYSTKHSFYLSREKFCVEKNFASFFFHQSVSFVYSPARFSILTPIFSTNLGWNNRISESLFF